MLDQDRVTISLGIATYNGGTYLNETLQSVCAQADAISEIIVVDDGSKDDSVKIICARLQGKPNVKIHVSAVNRGISESYNHILQLAQSEYIIIVDQDDLVPEGYIEAASRRLSNLSDPVVMACNWTSNERSIRVIGRLLRYLPEWIRIPRSIPVLGWIGTRSSLIYPVKLARDIGFESSSFDGFDAVHLDQTRAIVPLWWNSRYRFFYRVHPRATSAALREIVKPKGIFYSVEYRLRRLARRFIR